jgi:hypothetical protein
MSNLYQESQKEGSVITQVTELPQQVNQSAELTFNHRYNS